MKSDAQLQSEVQAEINASLAEPGEIGVAVHHGVVTLTGIVDTSAQKWSTERAAWRIDGVRAVAEEIEVRAARAEPTDSQIAEAVAITLEWSETVESNDVHARVEHGWVTLTGSVRTPAERDSAASLADQIKGVIGVSNRIQVTGSETMEVESHEDVAGWQPIDQEC
jgi:osmotically-inducible protein OsmY